MFEPSLRRLSPAAARGGPVPKDKPRREPRKPKKKSTPQSAPASTTQRPSA